MYAKDTVTRNARVWRLKIFSNCWFISFLVEPKILTVYLLWKQSFFKLSPDTWPLFFVKFGMLDSPQDVVLELAMLLQFCLIKLWTDGLPENSLKTFWGGIKKSIKSSFEFTGRPSVAILTSFKISWLMCGGLLVIEGSIFWDSTVWWGGVLTVSADTSLSFLALSLGLRHGFLRVVMCRLKPLRVAKWRSQFWHMKPFLCAPPEPPMRVWWLDTWKYKITTSYDTIFFLVKSPT